MSESEVHIALNGFLASQPAEIEDSEFDRIFDNTRDCLLTVGTFNEGVRDGADFVSSRYVDQTPCVGVSVGEGFPADKLIGAALLAQKKAHRPYAILFDLYPDYIVSTPTSLIGTILIEDRK